MHFAVGQLLDPKLSFIQLFSPIYAHVKIFAYFALQLFIRVPKALYLLFVRKRDAIKYCLLFSLKMYIICLIYDMLHVQWVFLRKLLLSRNVELNPGPETLSFCCWNLNSITAYDFLRVSLLEAYNSLYNHDIMGIVETHLDDTVDDERLALKGYEFIMNNHPLNKKRGGVGLYIRNSLPKKNRADLVTLPECIVCEIHLDKKSTSLLLFIEAPAKITMISMTFLITFSF